MNCIKRIFANLLIVTFIFAFYSINAQNSALIYHNIQKLKNTATIVYIAAHPDDENTRLISYLSNELKTETYYISLTTGEGGQNLIGKELGNQLGIIRKYELLEARKIDGGKQLFTSADDFGFSKSHEETFQKWDLKKLKNELYEMFITLNPDVVITRFAPFQNSKNPTHGHHVASAILAKMVFDSCFKNQKNKTLMWNHSWFFYGGKSQFDSAILAQKIDLLKENIGLYNTILGMSYTEMAALSRSKHSSQAFGTGLSRGDEFEYFQILSGNNSKKSILDGVESTWSRYAGGKEIDKMIDLLITNFDFNNPSQSINDLLKIKSKINALKSLDIAKISKKIEDLDQILIQCAGIHVSIDCKVPLLIQNQRFNFNLQAINRSQANVILKNIQFFSNTDSSIKFDKTLQNNNNFKFDYHYNVPNAIEISNYDNNNNVDLKFAFIELSINNQSIIYKIPLEYKIINPSKGEIIQPCFVAAPFHINCKQAILIQNQNNISTIEIELQSNSVYDILYLEPNLKNGFKSEPAFYKIENIKKNDKKNYTFKITPPKDYIGTYEIGIFLKSKEHIYTRSIQKIAYPHIPELYIFNECKSKIVYGNFQKNTNQYLYLQGSGDEIPLVLEGLSYQLKTIKPQELEQLDLSKYKSIIFGIRVMDYVDLNEIVLKKLQQYTTNGGKLIIQYNTNKTENNKRLKLLMPYPFDLSQNRITDENAKVNFKIKTHPFLNKPYLIQSSHFDNWIQERGLYFAKNLDSKTEDILEMQDINENVLMGGSLIVQNSGKGQIIYTGLSFFRQIPNGNTGAIQLFLNLID